MRYQLRLLHLLRRPSLFGFIVLAFAVVLWGYGYRLSLYNLHELPVQKNNVARMMADPLDAVTRVDKAMKRVLRIDLSLTALPANIFLVFAVIDSKLLFEAKEHLCSFFCGFPVALRAPPAAR